MQRLGRRLEGQLGKLGLEVGRRILGLLTLSGRTWLFLHRHGARD
jgi:hypothetical protein